MYKICHSSNRRFTTKWNMYCTSPPSTNPDVRMWNVDCRNWQENLGIWENVLEKVITRKHTDTRTQTRAPASDSTKHGDCTRKSPLFVEFKWCQMDWFGFPLYNHSGHQGDQIRNCFRWNSGLVEHDISLSPRKRLCRAFVATVHMFCLTSDGTRQGTNQ